MKAMLPTGSFDDWVAMTEVDEPDPAAHEAVIAVEAYSVNRGEIFLLEAPRPGWIPGKDVAGTVAVEAADGSGPPVGSRVVAHPQSGGWAERAAVGTDRLAVLPDSIPWVTGAALPLAGLTALRLLRTAGSVAGKRIVVTGASGGVGHYLVEMASVQGALVTAVSRSEERGRRLLELGAAEVVTDVESATGPFEIGMESVGGDSLEAVRRRLTPDGLLLWFGQASRQPPTIDFFSWEGAVSGTIRRFYHEEGSISYADDLATLVRLVARGHLHPEIGFTDDWTRTSRAIRALVDREVRGNAVLTVTMR